jgi:hypothetical protein
MECSLCGKRLTKKTAYGDPRHPELSEEYNCKDCRIASLEELRDEIDVALSELTNQKRSHAKKKNDSNKRSAVRDDEEFHATKRRVRKNESALQRKSVQVR